MTRRRGKQGWSQRMFRWLLALRADVAMALILALLGLVVVAQGLLGSPVIPYAYTLPIVLAAARFPTANAVLVALTSGALSAAVPALTATPEPAAHSVGRATTFVLVGVLVRALLPATRANLLEEIERARFDTTISQAIADGQMTLGWQPTVNLATGRTVGARAMLRWEHPVMGDVPPDTFIPLATRSEAIHEITAWVAEECAAQLAKWDSLIDNLPDFHVELSVTAEDLHEHLATIVTKAFERHGLSPSLASVAMTEPTLAVGGTRASKVLDALGSAGVKAAIAEVGTGYSDWRALGDGAVRRVKIHRSFVAGSASSVEDELTVERLTSLAHELGMEVIAEGVQTPQQLELMERAGVDHAEGWLFGRPLRPVEFEERLWSEITGAGQADPGGDPAESATDSAITGAA